MTARDGRIAATPPGVRLCLASDLPAGHARNFVLQMRAGRFHGFVVRTGEQASGYVDCCPHAGLPLAQKLDDYLTPDGRHIRCSWHGALFDKDNGRCVGGPCAGQILTPWPVEIKDGWIVTA
ncbi:Ferredoxin subunit of nitrite reductase or a ring-hydroxylating dioxygenase [Sphingobium sp. AP50]|uniref:Rieske (2Fe-2S) protein n=1 Tax=Sphingobium sp. AP50 TaxID=1884369 RepID=UPI0008C5F9AD|nr:Rieske (2Fe-2S) protein [Sphingobium sp. AP50]SEJ98571.1 Ferredoxin subunit of nitrite reductase or a ring-hydroxylating dioxygenase [Sphingobium sp. AP50]